MNANIFSCTVPPLLVLETQIIHPEVLQSLCISPCVPLGSIFLADVCARAETYAHGRKRLRARVDGCAQAQTGKGARRRLRPHAPICACPYPSTPARTHLHVPSPVCARTHRSARALRQRGSRFDTSASLKLPTVKKKIGKNFFTRRCPPKENGRTSMSVHPHPKPTSKPPYPSS